MCVRACLCVCVRVYVCVHACLCVRIPCVLKEDAVRIKTIYVNMISGASAENEHKFLLGENSWDGS